MACIRAHGAVRRRQHPAARSLALKYCACTMWSRTNGRYAPSPSIRCIRWHTPWLELAGSVRQPGTFMMPWCCAPMVTSVAMRGPVCWQRSATACSGGEPSRRQGAADGGNELG